MDVNALADLVPALLEPAGVVLALALPRLGLVPALLGLVLCGLGACTAGGAWLDACIGLACTGAAGAAAGLGV